MTELIEVLLFGSSSLVKYEVSLVYNSMILFPLR